jgi:hypothetical protein
MGEIARKQKQMKKFESLRYKIDKAQNELRNEAGEYRKATKREKIAILWEKLRKEALKLAFAVVVAECLMVIALHYGLKWGLYDLFQPKSKTIILIRPAEAKEIKQEDVKKDNIDQIADKIWLLESTRGKNNYSKCEAIGKINGIGYGISGNGKYQCFNSHDEEMQVLIGWIIDKRAKGMSEREMICLYSGNNYEGC